MQDEALISLRQELGSLRQASAVAAASEAADPVARRHSVCVASAGLAAAVPGGNSVDKNAVTGGRVTGGRSNSVGGGSHPVTAAAEGSGGGGGGGGGVRHIVDIMTRTFSLSSAESSAEGEPGLGAIAEEEGDEDDEGSECFTEDSDDDSDDGEEVLLSSDGEAREEGGGSEIGGEGDTSDGDTSEGSSSDDEREGRRARVLSVDDDDDDDAAFTDDVGDASASASVSASKSSFKSASKSASKSKSASVLPSRGLTLDKGKYAEDDDAAEAFAAARFGAKFGAANDEADDDDRRPTAGLRAAAARASLGGARSSIASSLSPGPRAAAKARRASTAPGSRSLSPLPRGGVAGGGATWAAYRGGVQVKAPSANCLSPMARLTPAEHGMGEEGNTVVLELGSWRVRMGVLEGGQRGSGGGGWLGGGGDEKRKSYFDDFACCLARPAREGADLDEVVNGASSLAAPMYSKFRE